MILPVYLYGQPVLRQKAEEVPADYPNLKQLVADMFETMYRAEGVGLAAPQVGLSLRLLVIDADVVKDDFPECKGFKRTMVNPVFLERSPAEQNFPPPGGREAIDSGEGGGPSSPGRPAGGTEWPGCPGRRPPGPGEAPGRCPWPPDSGK